MRTEATKDRIAARLHQHYVEHFVGTGAQLEFFLGHTVSRVEDIAVYVDGVRQKVSISGTANDYKIRGLTAGYVGDKNAITFTVAPIVSADIIIDVVST